MMDKILHALLMSKVLLDGVLNSFVIEAYNDESDPICCNMVVIEEIWL